MPISVRPRAARALAAAALIGVAVVLTACVSDSSGAAFGPPPTATTAPLPTQVPTPTVVPVDRSHPVAVVAGTPIPGAAFADLIDQQRQFYAYQALQQPGQTVPTDNQIRNFATNNLIDRAVTAQYAKQHAITVTPAQIDAQFRLFEIQNGGPVTFTNLLKNIGFTTTTFRVYIHDSLLEQRVAQRVTPLPASVEQVRARHILVKTKALADRLYLQLEANPSRFAALAKKFSTDTGSAKSGGELGFFGRGQMVAPFERAAFSQPIGEVGRPVQSQFGYHIIQVEAIKHVPFAQLDQQTQQTLATNQQNAFRNWLRAQRPKYHVRVLLPPAQTGGPVPQG